MPAFMGEKDEQSTVQWRGEKQSTRQRREDPLLPMSRPGSCVHRHEQPGAGFWYEFLDFHGTVIPTDHNHISWHGLA